MNTVAALVALRFYGWKRNEIPKILSYERTCAMCMCTKKWGGKAHSCLKSNNNNNAITNLLSNDFSPKLSRRLLLKAEHHFACALCIWHLKFLWNEAFIYGTHTQFVNCWFACSSLDLTIYIYISTNSPYTQIICMATMHTALKPFFIAWYNILTQFCSQFLPFLFAHSCQCVCVSVLLFLPFSVNESLVEWR